MQTIVSKHAHLALLVATLARPAWSTGTAAIDGIAGGIVLTLADAATPVAIMIQIAGSIALVVAPAVGTQALSRLRGTLSSILAITFEGTILSIAANRATFLALLSREARRTKAGSIDRRTLRAVAAITV